MPKTWHFRLNFPTENAEASSVKMIEKTAPENHTLMPETAYSHVYFTTEASSVKFVKKNNIGIVRPIHSSSKWSNLDRDYVLAIGGSHCLYPLDWDCVKLGRRGLRPFSPIWHKTVRQIGSSSMWRNLNGELTNSRWRVSLLWSFTLGLCQIGEKGRSPFSPIWHKTVRPIVSSRIWSNLDGELTNSRWSCLLYTSPSPRD